MQERLIDKSQSAKDERTARFNPPQARTITMQALVIVVVTVVAGLRVVAVGIAAWWLIPLALVLCGLLLCIDVSVEVSAEEITVRPWLGQLARLPWRHRYPLWALVAAQRLPYGSLRLIFIAAGRERRVILWSLGFPPRHIPALLRAIQTNPEQ